MKFTLVSTVFNEEKRLRETIEDLKNQTVKPDEIIITDAGSKDKTVEILNAAKEFLPIKVIIEKGCNVSRGRNIAIQNAENDLIVSTDFGCRFKKNWTESLVKHFENSDCEAVAGAFGVKIDDIQTCAAKADYIIQNGYPTANGDEFSGSSRSIAYKKSVWEKIGGYHEWLTLAADDTVFWRELKAKGIKYEIESEVCVFWNRHKTAKQFAKEAGRYGLGDGETRINFKNFLSLTAETVMRYLLLPVIIVFCFLDFEIQKFVWPILIFMLFGLRSYIRVIKNFIRLKDEKIKITILPMCFYMIETQRIAYIKNYLRGRFFISKEKKEEAKKLGVK